MMIVDIEARMVIIIMKGICIGDWRKIMIADMMKNVMFIIVIIRIMQW